MRLFALVVSTSIVVAACGGGNGGSAVPPGTTAAAPAAPITTQSETVVLSTTAATTATYTLSTYTATATFPASSAAASLATVFTTTQPSVTPTIQSLRRRPANIGASPLSILAYLEITSTATTTLSGFAALSLVVPASVASGASYAYVAAYDPTNPSAGWNTVEGPATVSGTTLTFSSIAPGPTLQANQTYYLAIFTLASLAPTPSPSPTMSATANPLPSSSAGVSPNAATAYTCPTSDSQANGTSGHRAAGAGADATRRASGLRVTRPSVSTAGMLAVTYSSAIASGTAATQAVARESAAGATLVRTFDFAHTGKVIHVLSVPAAKITAVEATLRTQAGVQSVAPTGALRYASGVSAPYFTNDPYFNGFTAAQNSVAGMPAASTYQVAPYEESSAVAGQWDMHAIGLQRAFAYGNAGNTVAANANALGSATVKIAMIDSGADPTHAELASKIAYQKCFITNAAGTVQSTSTFETDPLGHGTDTAGIAGEDTNNGFGFTGAGGNSMIYAYRVFPTPDDNCVSPVSTDTQCGANTADIASAIDDAVAQKVNVISLSLGGTTCGTGTTYAPNGDSDPVEGAAVAEAIAANIIVVASSGNSAPTVTGVAAPACDTGVIAVGASALADGATNGSSFAGGSPTAPVEYVADYTQFGTTNTLNSASSWGIVAPGGDPASDYDTDDLHWIENIWTSTPYMSSSSDTDFAGMCNDDYPNGSALTAPVDCRTLIAGTSMSAPHVAGAAALILAVNASYQSPAAMKTLLCQTADSIAATTSPQGCGRLDVYRAMATALNDPSPPGPNPTP